MYTIVIGTPDASDSRRGDSSCSSSPAKQSSGVRHGSSSSSRCTQMSQAPLSCARQLWCLPQHCFAVIGVAAPAHCPHADKLCGSHESSASSHVSKMVASQWCIAQQLLIQLLMFLRLRVQSSHRSLLCVPHTCMFPCFLFAVTRMAGVCRLLSSARILYAAATAASAPCFRLASACTCASAICFHCLPLAERSSEAE